MPDKTRTDDMLIEMIEPKVNEIKSKFSSKEPLTQEDIHTLLLHSQYNHINHLDRHINRLDERLNQVTTDVASLKSSFQLLEQKFESSKQVLEQKFALLEQKFVLLGQKFEVSKSEIKQEVLRAINSNMRWSIGIIAGIVTLLKLLDVLLG